VPFLNQHQFLIDLLSIKMWFLSTIFFASIFLACANLIYDIVCPNVVKRFESPNDLYMRMLEIKEKSVLLYPADNFDSSINHCKIAYNRMSFEKPYWRMACSLLYLGSGCLFGVVLAYRLLVVSKTLLIGN
jgi:hypothetical protein